MSTILFYHGGPGLNANPERMLLTNIFTTAGHTFHCWDEPSALRPDGFPFEALHAFDNYFRSSEEFFLRHYAGEPLLLMGHSIAANIISFLASRYPDKIQALVYIAPDHLLSQTDRNTLTFVAKDYRAHGDPRGKELEKIIAKFSDHFDDNLLQGFSLMLQNPRFLDYYWVDKAKMQQYVDCYGGRYSIDPASLLSVRRTWRDSICPTSKINMPMEVIFGKQDMVVSNEEEWKLLQSIGSPRAHFFADSGHFPHWEEKDRLLEILRHYL